MVDLVLASPSDAVKVTAPETLPAGIANHVAWSADGRYLAVAHYNSPRVTIYDWDTGSPVKIDDPSALPASTGWGVGWSPNDRYLGVAHANSPRITFYDWDTGSPVKIDDPGTLPTGDGYDVKWSPNGRYAAVAHATTPFITIYDWDTGSPVKIDNPTGGLPASQGTGVAWSPNGRYLAVSHYTTPFVTIYDWNSGSPVKMDNPADLPAGVGQAVAWSPDGRHLIVAHSTTPFATIYDWDTGAPVKITTPTPAMPSTGNGVSWTSDGRYSLIGHNSSPYLRLYDWGTGSPAVMGAPSPSVATTAHGVAFSPDDVYFAVAHRSETDPYLTVFERPLIPDELLVSLDATEEDDAAEVVVEFSPLAFDVTILQTEEDDLPIFEAVHDPIYRATIFALEDSDRAQFSASQEWDDSLLARVEQVFYTCYAIADGFDPLYLPISSWQATLQTGRSSYVQAVVPAASALYAGITARANAGGEFLIYSKATVSGSSFEREIARAPLQTLRFDQGPQRATVTISGYTQIPASESSDRTLRSARSISVGSGLRVRCAINLDLRPGQTAIIDGQSFEVAYLNFYVGRNDAYMDVGERAL
jgi:hypothetical protein